LFLLLVGLSSSETEAGLRRSRMDLGMFLEVCWEAEGLFASAKGAEGRAGEGALGAGAFVMVVEVLKDWGWWRGFLVPPKASCEASAVGRVPAGGEEEGVALRLGPPGGVGACWDIEWLRGDEVREDEAGV